MKLLCLRRNASMKQIGMPELLLYLLTATCGVLCSFCFPLDVFSAAFGYTPIQIAGVYFLIQLLILLCGFSLIGSPAVLCLDFVYGYLTADLCRCCFSNNAILSFKWTLGFLLTVLSTMCLLVLSHYSCRTSLDILRRLKGDSSLRSRLIGFVVASLFALFTTTIILAIVLPELDL